MKVLSIVGTRPEVIKMAPVIKELECKHDSFDSNVMITGQHMEMCKPYLDLFDITPRYDLSIMEENQTLNDIVIKILKRLPVLLGEIKPDIILVQGDTTSAFAAALAAYHSETKVGHIEAGLRTFNKYNPYPEEMNRHLIGVLADLHFAPTKIARNNLINEGVSPDNIYLTGNTVIDALMFIVKDSYEFDDEVLKAIDFNNKKIICVTTHRRESFGIPLQNTLKALKQIVNLFKEVEIILPVHYNPNVKNYVYDLLGDVNRIHLIEPLPYEPFVQLLNKCYLILTDSGGIQEEAPSLGKPVLVLRETTERPEGIEAGTAVMVGTDVEIIVSKVEELIKDANKYNEMAQIANPYGDGNAAYEIVDILKNVFS